MISSHDITARTQVFTTQNGGIEHFFSENENSLIREALTKLDTEPLSKVQFNQLLGLSLEIGVSDDFFKYYWLNNPKVSYKLSVVPGYSDYSSHDKIINFDHLLYGFHRIYIDGLLLRGNVRAYFREFSNAKYRDIERAAGTLVLNTEAIKQRGPAFSLVPISKDDRYLISEMACKSYGESPDVSVLRSALVSAWERHSSGKGGAIKIRDLLGGELSTEHAPQQQMFIFSVDDILEESVTTRQELEEKFTHISKKFSAARKAALENTKLYLSLVNDLDVYVATSMRKRDDFRSMASCCEKIFNDPRVSDLHLRYFDPTMSAADGHQDKGLIECLMVKCAKILVYCAGEKESYGKDAEAAMALSLGKPVIFFCDEAARQNFYQEVHPLSRLINFETGVAVGAIVATSEEQVAVLLDRIFENEMEYTLSQPIGRAGYLQLKDSLTGSVVRIQTENKLLAEVFWNYYKSHQ